MIRQRSTPAAIPTVLAGMAVASSTLMALGAHSASAEVPKWIAPEPSDPSGRPLWVSVEAALTTDHSLRSELFSPEFVAMEPPDESATAPEPEGDAIVTECAAVVPYDCDQSGPSRGRDTAELYANSRFHLFLREPVVSLRLRRFCIDGASRTPPAIGARVLLLLDQDPAAMPGGDAPALR